MTPVALTTRQHGTAEKTAVEDPITNAFVPPAGGVQSFSHTLQSSLIIPSL